MKAEVIGGIAYVVPRLEPFATAVAKMGRFAAFLYCRWDAWGIGIQILRAGLAVQVGPFMVGIAHIDRQVAAFDLAAQREAA